MRDSPQDYDVAVVGGAFAGASSALLLKRANPGLRVLVIERKQSFDRKVGESAIELSSWFLTRVLGLERHLALQQLPKYGLRFWFQNDKVTTLAGASELGGRYQSRVPSFHIDRAILDEHVLSLAVASGARLMRPARVLDADLKEGGRSTLEVESASQRMAVSARWVIDATGRKAWLARKLGLLEPMPAHPTHSVWARYRGVGEFDGDWLSERKEGGGAITARGLSTNHLTGPGWWVWFIPLPGGDVSVGVVWDDRIFSLPPGENIGQRFETFLHSFPAGRELMAGATRLDDDLHALHNLPYRVRQVAGDGWTMVGDAAGFIDPFYSPGLDWAAITVTKTAELVARAVRGESVRDDVARHNLEFVRGFGRWFEALYLDKYYYMGDAELMEIALRWEVALYYLGIVSPPYRGGIRALEIPFADARSVPFFYAMAWMCRRLAGLGRLRLEAGTWGRRNAGQRVLLPGFTPGISCNLGWLPGAVARLMAAEIRSIPDRIAIRRRRRASSLGSPAAQPATVAAQSSAPAARPPAPAAESREPVAQHRTDFEDAERAYSAKSFSPR